MATKKSAKPKKASGDDALADLMRTIDHPLKKQVESSQAAILAASAAVGEGIKWNSLSFRTTEYFATWNWRCRDRVQFVFHRGAKAKDNSRQVAVSEPDSGALEIKWLAKDRCLVTLAEGAGPKARSALSTFVREWIEHV